MMLARLSIRAKIIAVISLMLLVMAAMGVFAILVFWVIFMSVGRPVTEPVNSRRRSLSVDFPWSMWAMMAKLRRKRASMEG